MAFTDDTLSKSAFKTLQGKAHTGNSKDLPNETEPTAPTLAAQEIFAETIDFDPNIAVSQLRARFVALDLVEDTSSNGKAYDAIVTTVAGSGLDGYQNPRTGLAYADGDRVGFFIPPKFDEPSDPPPSASYRAILKDNGAEVAPSDATNWYFDYRAGIVVSETDLSLGVTGTIEAYVYVGQLADAAFSIINGVDASVLDLYVNTVTGNDGYDGLTPSTAFKTVQHAVYVFKSPASPPHWPGDTIRTIHVAGNVAESIIVPAHTGEGFLRIRSSDEVLAETGLTTTGAFAQTAGTATEVLFTFSGGALTANAYDLAGFVYPDAPGVDPKSESYESLPIIANGTGDFRVVAADPGNWTAFTWGTGVAFSVYQPGATWSHDGYVTPGFDRTPRISNIGESSLIIEGFEFTGTGPIIGGGAAGYQYFTLLQRCILTDTAELFAGGNVGANVIVNATSLFNIGSEVTGTIVNSILDLAFLNASYGNRISVYGLWTNKETRWVSCLLYDVFMDQTAGDHKLDNTSATYWAYFQGSSGQMQLVRDSHVTIEDPQYMLGTTSDGYAITLNSSSTITVDNWFSAPSTATLTGAMGDVKLGPSGTVAVATWGGGSVQGDHGHGTTYTEIGTAVGKMIESTVDRTRFAEVSAPATPASGFGTAYAKTDGYLYYKNDGGVEFDLTVGSGGAGDVTKVGTPVDNQVGVWTGDGTIEGTGTLVFDATGLGVGMGTPNAMLTVEGAISLDEIAAPASTAGYGKLYGSTDGYIYYKNAAGAEYNLATLGEGGGGGDVTKVGTPVDNQIGVWTGDGTIEGDSGLTWDGSTLTTVGGITQNTGAVGLTANAASSFTTSSGALTITSAAATTWSTTAGQLTINGNGGIVFNEGGLNADLRIEGDADPNLFVADANALAGSAGAIGIGTATPNEKLTVEGAISLDEISAPSSTAGYGKLYGSADGYIYYKNAAGAEYNLATLGEGGGGGGDVTKVGTPVDNEIGVWTGDGTIEGDTSLTWSGTAMAIGGNGTELLPSLTFGTGDTDTGIWHPAANVIAFSANGAERMRISNNNVIINTAGDNADFRIEGDTSSALLFVNGGEDRLQVGSQADFTETDSILLVTGGPIALDEIAAPGTPDTGYGFLYPKVDGYIYWKNDAAEEFNLFTGAAGGGSGDVLKVGTPVDNEIGVWTGDGTLEGDSNFTWSGTAMEIGVDGTEALPALTFGATTDPNTGIWHPAADTLAISAGGAEVMRFGSSAIVINEDGDSGLDFRVEGNTDTHLLFVDAGNDVVGIGTSTPDTAAALHVERAQIAGGEEIQRWTVSDESTAKLVVNNKSATVAEFEPQITGTGEGTLTALTLRAEGTTDTGSTPIMAFAAQNVGGGSPATRPLYKWYRGNLADEMMALDETGFIWNDVGFNAFDFRIEGDTRSNLFFVDAGQDMVGINRTTGNLGATLDVDNLALTENIMVLRDNGTAVFTVPDAMNTPGAGDTLYANNTDGYITWGGMRRVVQFEDDFIDYVTDSRWTETLSGTGAVVSQISAVSIGGAGVAGVIEVETGTSTSGFVIFTTSNTAMDGLDNYDIFVFEGRVRIEDLSTASQEYITLAGMAAVNDTIQFSYDRTSSTFWEVRNTKDVTSTTTTTTTTCAADTWYTLRAVYTASGTPQIEFFINGTSVATHTTNIPDSAGDSLGAPQIHHAKSAGTTSRSMYCDYLSCWGYLNADR
jgi:hypothetical protein